MTKIQDIKTRNILNQIEFSCRTGNKINYFYYYKSERDKHIYLKFETYKKLRELGYDCLCEVKFKIGIRMDILAWRNSRFINVEILSSESLEQLKEKVKKYPNIEIICIKCKDDIAYLE
jgi:hypothetical protein